MPLDLLRQGRLDGLWNEDFKRMVRNAVLGTQRRRGAELRVVGAEADRLPADRASRDGAQAVNYVGSHDVEGLPQRAAVQLPHNNGVALKEERIKLAFVCLLTAVGRPDDLRRRRVRRRARPERRATRPSSGTRSTSSRLEEPLRRRVFDYVARLVQLRTSSRGPVRQRHRVHPRRLRRRQAGAGLAAGRDPGSGNQVVVVANFSDFDSGRARAATNTACRTGRRRRREALARGHPGRGTCRPEWVGREAVFAWEAKVYALV